MQQTPLNKTMKITKSGIRYKVKMSDELRHYYDESSKKFSQQLLTQKIKSITLYEKQLDNPLSWYKKTFAKIFHIKTKHQFIVFQLNSGIYGSIDLYRENKIQLRLGDINTIAETNLQGKRKNSIMVQKQGKPYNITFDKEELQSVTLNDLIQIMYEVTPETGFSELSFNGMHFSRAIMREIRKQKKGDKSTIRFKLVNEPVQFQPN